MKPVSRNYYPLLFIVFDWAIILGAVTTALSIHGWLVTSAAMIVIATRQHALLVLTHEAVHMNLAPNRIINDTLADIFCSYPLLFDTHAYRVNHLQHHRSLNTDQDPDWVRKVGKAEWTFPVTKKSLALFLLYFVCFKGAFEWLYIGWKFSGFGDRQQWKNKPLRLSFKLFYFLLAAVLIAKTGIVQDVAVFWFAPLLFIFPSIQRLRSVAEHFALPYSSDMDSTRDVLASAPERFLFAPHNVGLHLTHHYYPHVPFLHLPQVRDHLLQTGEFKNAYTNDGYLRPSSNSVLHDVLYGAREVTSQKTAPTADTIKLKKSA